MIERAAPGHVALVRQLLIDALTRDQLVAIADGPGEASRRMLAELACSEPDGSPRNRP